MGTQGTVKSHVKNVRMETNTTHVVKCIYIFYCIVCDFDCAIDTHYFNRYYIRSITSHCGLRSHRAVHLVGKVPQ